MPLSSKRRYPNVGTRRKIGLIGQAAQLPRRTPISITNTVPGLTTVVTLDQAALVLTGVPRWPQNTGAMPTAATLSAPNEVTLTYSAPAPTTITVPFEDSAIRNGAGGYVLPGTFS